MRAAAGVCIGLLRHGETAGGARYRGRTDDPLTAAGWAQMWAAANDPAAWETIITSPLSRCADFSRALAQRHSIPLHTDARLQEIDFGAWEGRTAADIMDTAPDTLARFWEDPWNNGPPGGEPLRRMQARVLAAWRDAVALRRRALLISHGGPIRVILCHAFGLPREQLLQLEVAQGALHRLTVRAADAAIETVA